MRVVLDTNVFISGIFWEGNFCSQIIDAWKEKRVELVSSLEIVDELVETLGNFKISLPEEVIEEWRVLILENARIIEPSLRIEVILQDPDDNKFLEAAIAGEAQLVVSQDKHLLNLKSYHGIKIIKPEEAVNIIFR